MTQILSRMIVWGCNLTLLAVPAAAVYLAIDLSAFKELAFGNLPLPIQWRSVAGHQWYLAWFATVLYLALGLAGLVYLRRAFVNFARGELFNEQNSRYFRRFAIFLFAQALAKPLHFAALSVILSWNHPAGQSLLSISFGANEFRNVALGAVLWVMSDLLVAGSRLRAENQAFV